ncbi:hypothetical protein BH11ARM1_BH11ARM1_11170 [soil metagenome]
MWFDNPERMASEYPKSMNVRPIEEIATECVRLAGEYLHSFDDIHLDQLAGYGDPTLFEVTSPEKRLADFYEVMPIVCRVAKGVEISLALFVYGSPAMNQPIKDFDQLIKFWSENATYVPPVVYFETKKSEIEYSDLIPDFIGLECKAAYFRYDEEVEIPFPQTCTYAFKNVHFK